MREIKCSWEQKRALCRHKQAQTGTNKHKHMRIMQIRWAPKSTLEAFQCNFSARQRKSEGKAEEKQPETTSRQIKWRKMSERRGKARCGTKLKSRHGHKLPCSRRKMWGRDGKDSHIHMALFTVSEPRKRKARKWNETKCLHKRFNRIPMQIQLNFISGPRTLRKMRRRRRRRRGLGKDKEPQTRGGIAGYGN